MFSHIMVGTNDLDKARAFYDAVLGTLGIGPGIDAGHRIFYRTPTGNFAVSKPINGEPATFANGGTIGFACASAEQTAAFHAAGLANGGTCEGAPDAPRQGMPENVSLAYLRDPDGNKLCALHRG